MLEFGDIIKILLSCLMGAVLFIFKKQDSRLSDIEEQCKSIAPFRVIERVNRNTEDIANIKSAMSPIQYDVTKILTILEERDKQWQRETGK